MLTRRLVVLIDDDRYGRLEREAQRRQVSVAVVVRDALDDAFPPAGSSREQAIAWLLAAPPVGSFGDPADLRRELDDVRTGGS